jgi:hypothetical protein
MNALRRVCECEVRSDSGGRQSRNFPDLNGATAAARVPLSVQPQPGVCEQLMNSSCDLHALSFQIVKGHVTFAVGEVEVKQVLPRMDEDNGGKVFKKGFQGSYGGGFDRVGKNVE